MLIIKRKNVNSLCLNFFHLLFIQTIFFIILTCPNPVLLVHGFGKVGSHEDRVKNIHRLFQ